MVNALLFTALISCAGFALLRLVGLSKGTLAVTLAPGVGLGLVGVVTSWLALLHAPPPVSGVLITLIGVVGLIALVAERRDVLAALRTWWSHDRLGLIFFGLCVVVPCIVMATGFANVDVPLSRHD